MMHNTKAKSSLFPELIDAVIIKSIGAAAIAAPAMSKALNPRFFRNVICLYSLLSLLSSWFRGILFMRCFFMKKFRRAVCAFLLLALLMLPAFAHGGGTDWRGGHNSSSGYHFHHGYGPHQHPGGVCPYDFDDKTGENGGGNSRTATTPKPTGAPTPVQSAEKSTGAILWAFSIPVGFVLLLLMYEHIKDKADRKKYTALYSGKSTLELCGAPDGFDVGTDGLPKEANANGWGKSLTFYVSKTGRSFHANQRCNKQAHVKIHAVNLGNRRSCGRCNPVRPPDFRWYYKYKEIGRIKQKYKIE